MNSSGETTYKTGRQALKQSPRPWGDAKQNCGSGPALGLGLNRVREVAFIVADGSVVGTSLKGTMLASKWPSSVEHYPYRRAVHC